MMVYMNILCFMIVLVFIVCVYVEDMLKVVEEFVVLMFVVRDCVIKGKQEFIVLLVQYVIFFDVL